MEPPKEHKKPETNHIKISMNKNSNFFVYLAKRYLEDFETIEFHALGNAASVAVQAAENLVRNEYVVFESIQTKTIEIEGYNNREAKKAKLFITLKRSPNFKQVMENSLKIKEENQILSDKYKTADK